MRKEAIIAFSLLCALPVVAAPQIKATQVKGGAWIEVKEDGLPVKSAVINGEYLTDDFGRVYINNTYEFSRTAHYNAVTPNGDTLKTQLFLANEKNK